MSYLTEAMFPYYILQQTLIAVLGVTLSAIGLWLVSLLYS